MLIHDSNTVKGKYILRIVEQVFISSDGFVRSSKVSYRISKETRRPEEYR